MRREGQATLAIDQAAKIAYITDLGHKGDGDKIRIKGKSLIDYLVEDEHIERLVITCSHPHDDHAGGVAKLFENPLDNFFYGKDPAKPKFKSMAVIDDGVKDSLAFAYEAFGKAHPELDFKHVTVTESAGAKVEKTTVKTGGGGKGGKKAGRKKPVRKLGTAPASVSSKRNAFAALGLPQQDIQIENIPYKFEAKAGESGIHGRSIITMITLKDDTNPKVIVDFDDADSGAIESAVQAIKAKGITRIEAFIVPHHGSSAHDIGPILELKPTKAIIAVNATNRFRHPHGVILDTLMTEIGGENIVFTGTDGDVLFDGKGLKQARYTANSFESYVLYVSEGRAKIEAESAKAQKRSKVIDDEIAAYERIYRRMRPGPLFPPPDAPSPIPPSPGPRPWSPSSGGAVGAIAERIGTEGSMFARGFDAAYVPPTGVGAANLNVGHIFAARADNSAVVYSSSLEPYGAGDLRGFPGEVPGKNVEVRFQSATGLPSAMIPSQTYVAPASSVSTPVRARKDVPTGGMVFLDGGNVVVEGNRLEKPRLEIGQEGVWLGTAGGRYRLPFTDVALFSEVMARVKGGTRSFYLSINPKKQFLKAGFDIAKIPSGKLAYGSSPEAAQAFNDVVTDGDIGTSRIGDILWRADVAFKSGALGFNVFNTRPASSVEQWIDNTVEDDGYSDVPEGDRWCRLYWTSGDPHFVFDEVGGAVKVSGLAVVARSEAMTPKGGKLVSVPDGKWCGREKRLAASLQARANSARADGVFLELKQLALMQAFSIWVDNNRVDLSSVTFDKGKPIAHIPTWTSGIRTPNTTLVRLEKDIRQGFHGYNLHYWTADPQALTNCFASYYPHTEAQWNGFGAVMNAKRELAISPANIPKLDKGVSNMVEKLASCGGARLLEPISSTMAKADSTVALLGASRHALSAQIHGGVLLGKAGAPKPFDGLREADAILWSDDGRLLFRNVDGELHFWNLLGDNVDTALGAQHIVVTEGAFDDAYADDGHLRILVKAAPGAFVRQELRIRGHDGTGGAEWLQISHASTGDEVFNAVVSPCADKSKGAQCFEAVEMTDQDPADVLAEHGGRRSSIDVSQVEDGVWLVDLDLGRTEAGLSAKWDASRQDDSALAVSTALDLARWGFREKAAGIIGDQLPSLSPDADDTLLRDRVAYLTDRDKIVMRYVLAVASAVRESAKQANAAKSKPKVAAKAKAEEEEVLMPATVLQLLNTVDDVRADTSPPAVFTGLSELSSACADYAAAWPPSTQLNQIKSKCAGLDQALKRAESLAGPLVQYRVLEALQAHDGR